MPLVLAANINLACTNKEAETYFQSEREIPVVEKVYVLVVGGTMGAVSAALSAALSAAEKGAKVFLVGFKTYLGEDVCATLRLKRNAANPVNHSLEKQIFGNSNQTTPLKVKATLSKALIDAGPEL